MLYCQSAYIILCVTVHVLLLIIVVDEIIKIRKTQGTNRASSVASSSRSRGAQNQRMQRGNRGMRPASQRGGYGQLRGQSLRGRQQVTQVSQVT